MYGATDYSGIGCTELAWLLPSQVACSLAVALEFRQSGPGQGGILTWGYLVYPDRFFGQLWRSPQLARGTYWPVQ